MKKTSSKVIKSNDQQGIPHATVKEAVQKRVIHSDHSSIIPGINVNELKHSLDLLKYALDYSEAIVDTVRLPLVVLNKKLQVITANRSFYETFKLMPSETENKLIYRLNANAWNIPRLKLLLEKILPSNTHFDDYEVEVDFPHIGRRTIVLNARRTYRQVNNTEAILLAFEDITDRKQIEKQKDDFIGIASHELKTPITTMKGYAQMLEKHISRDGNSKDIYFIQNIVKQTDRLTSLINDLLHVSKIQVGKLVLEKKRFDLNALATKIVVDFQYMTETHQIIKDGEINEQVSGDQHRIEQVFVNLINNAIKYSPDADKVIVRVGTDKKNAIVSVQDFGFGIAKNDHVKIFERFYRTVEKERIGVAGFGLGLYISAEIIKIHKGKIWVESEKGKGSIFYFTLPLK